MLGVVLAGGKSVRLGQDKTKIIHEGQTLLKRAIDLLGGHCSQVYVSCRHPETVPQDTPFIMDTTRRIGPLGGILTSLQQLNSPILVLACDLPFMQDHFLEKLVQARALRPPHCVMTTWQEQETGYIQALVAIYEPASRPFLEQGLVQEQYQLNKLVPKSLRHTLFYSKSEGQAFFNINRPEDLEYLTLT